MTPIPDRYFHGYRKPKPTKKGLAGFLALMCPMPDAMRSHEDFERYTHLDLNTKPRVEMEQELKMIRGRLQMETSSDPWFRERKKVLEERLR